MARNLCACMLAFAALAMAQAPAGHDAWLMKNYHFTGPPRAASLTPVDPVVSELRQIQGTLTSIMRKADFVGDWETAIIAASQAASNAQLMGVISERLQESAAAAQKTAEAQPAASSPIYSIALKDRTIDSAIAWWVDGLMLHYLTPRGAHVQVRLDLVDRDLTARINRARNLELILP
jgi:hypothetical protein